MLLKWLSNGFFVLSFVLLAAGGVGWWFDANPARVTIRAHEREVPGVVAGELVDVEFELTNPTWRPARVVGLAEC